MTSLTDVKPTQTLRDLSNSLFGRPHQLEIAVAIASHSGALTIDEVLDLAQMRAGEAGLDVPKRGAVSKSIDRLVLAKALEEFPSPRPGSPCYFTQIDGSSFWGLVGELCGAD
jgi:hypothetical protein